MGLLIREEFVQSTRWKC